MTIYQRPDERVFSENAQPGEVQEFPDVPRGWGVAFEQSEGKPPMEWFNWLHRRFDRALRYLVQRGIPEWSVTEDYPVHARVQHNGATYRALVPSVGIEPGTSVITWHPWASSSASDIDAGVLAVARGGTGLTGVAAGDVLMGGGNNTVIGRTMQQLLKDLGGIATEAEAQAMTRNDVFMTPAMLRAAFMGPNLNTGTQGFMRHPSGLIEQWGRVDVVPGTRSRVTFPITHPTALLNFQLVNPAGTTSGYADRFAGWPEYSLAWADVVLSNQAGHATVWWRSLGI